MEIALEKEIIKSKSIIVDTTHTKARYNQMKPKEILMERSKKLKKAIYQFDESMKSKFPSKTKNDVFEKEETLIQYLVVKEQHDHSKCIQQLYYCWNQ